MAGPLGKLSLAQQGRQPIKSQIDAQRQLSHNTVIKNCHQRPKRGRAKTMSGGRPMIWPQRRASLTDAIS
eukprot:1072255-Prymnesium_polylepis.1